MGQGGWGGWCVITFVERAHVVDGRVVWWVGGSVGGWVGGSVGVPTQCTYHHIYALQGPWVKTQSTIG